MERTLFDPGTMTVLNTPPLPPPLMTCPACKRQIQGHARFCPYCAEALRRCRSCDIFFLSDVAFCGSCGQNLRANTQKPLKTLQMPQAMVEEPPKRAPKPTDPAAYGYLRPAASESPRFYLYEGDTLIGAGGNNDIIIPHRAVSWTHAIIICRDGKVMVQDSASTNGTFVNDERIRSPRQLRQGDRLRFGGEEFQVHINSNR